MSHRLGLKLPKTSGIPMWSFEKSAGDWGVRAEGLGYDSIWTSEAWGSHAFVELAEVAVRTEDLRIGTAIANAFSRSPAVLAMAGASLNRLSDGRAVLGVGASHPEVIEGLHGMDYHRPVRRTHETIELVKAMSQGQDPVNYDGELLTSRDFPALDDPFPVYNAALGEANRRVTGRLADGWIPYLVPFSRLEESFETVAMAARGENRDPDDIEVVPQVLAVVDDDTDSARLPIREYVARYVGDFDAYRNAFSVQFPDVVEEIAEAWQEGDTDGAVEHVTDELVQEVGVAGPPEIARTQLRKVLDIEVVDSCIVYVPNGTPRDILDRTIEELSPRNL